jgi:ubiquinol-cytochrome c reductase cytochrome b subunit
MSLQLADTAARHAESIDARYHPSAAVRRQLNKVFPTHRSFLLGEIALYSFVVPLITGIYLTLFFDPSMAEVTYNGVYQPLRGIEMSKAYASALNISFEVRGGLFVRQVHHWAALMFAASIMVHLARVFFTGAFRRPREANWVIGSLLLMVIGTWLHWALLGGDFPGTTLIPRLYALHILVLPAIILALRRR